MTTFDYLSYTYQKELYSIDKYRYELERYIKENVREYCSRTPISLAQECIFKTNKFKISLQLKQSNIIEKKIIRRKTAFLGEESLSTSNSSGYYNRRILMNIENKSPIKKK